MVILWWKKLRKNSVVNVEGIRCWKCSVGKMLPVMYALLIGKNLSRKYGEAHKEEKKAYNQEYNRREVECESCECRVKKCKWLRHVGSKKHRDGVENGEGGGDMDVDAGGGEEKLNCAPRLPTIESYPEIFDSICQEHMRFCIEIETFDSWRCSIPHELGPEGMAWRFRRAFPSRQLGRLTRVDHVVPRPKSGHNLRVV